MEKHICIDLILSQHYTFTVKSAMACQTQGSKELAIIKF